ncbi:MAG: response regulator [Anaerolineaceae bacterium]|nr:response regulator [Anaerolineaceae bacterium]
MKPLEQTHNILVIDHKMEFADSLVTQLSELGYQAVAAYSGRQGIESYENHGFALVISEVDMQDINGMDVLEAVHARDPKARVIMVTERGTVDGAVKAIKKGAFDYLPKQFSLEELKTIMDRAFSSRNEHHKFNTTKVLVWGMGGALLVWFTLGYLLKKYILQG